MSSNRMFRGRPVRRLIVSVELDTVKAIDQLQPRGNRSEFVRLAIEEKLRRLTS